MSTSQVRELEDHDFGTVFVRQVEHSTYGGALVTPSQGSFCCYLAMEQNRSRLTMPKGEPPKRFGLTDAFRAQASWGDGSHEPESGQDTGVVLVRMVRTIDPEDYARRGNWLEAINL